MNVDISGTWIHYFPTALEMSSVKVQIEKQGDNFKFKIPFGGFSEGIEVEMHFTTKNKLSGTYKILAHDFVDKIECEMLEDGKRLEAFPEGFNIREKWVFQSETPAKVKVEPEESFIQRLYHTFIGNRYL